MEKGGKKRGEDWEERGTVETEIEEEKGVWVIYIMAFDYWSVVKV